MSDETKAEIDVPVEKDLNSTGGRVQENSPYKQPHEVPGAEPLSEDPAGPSAPVVLDRKLDGVEAVDFAGELYAVYSDAVGGVNFQGDALPTWDEFRADQNKVDQSDAWVVVAQHVIDKYS